MADWNNPQTWIDSYSKRGGFPGLPGFGEPINYLDGRKYAINQALDGSPGLAEYRNRISKISSGGSFTPAADTIILGCGLGWLVEAISDLGSNSVWGADTSTLIQSLWDDPLMEIRADIRALLLPVDFMAPDAPQQFKSFGAGNNSGKFRNVVTENLLEDWPIATIQDALDAMEALLAPGQSQVFHLVKAVDLIPDLNNIDSSLVPNQFTLQEWISLRPSHIWIDDHEGAFGGGL